MSRWLNSALECSSRGFGYVVGGMAASAVVNSVASGIGHLTDTPNMFNCSRCKAPVAVPDSAWSWRCIAGACQALNDKHAASCEYCGAGKPPQQAPKVQCGQCHAILSVPASNFSKAFHSLIPRSVRPGQALGGGAGIPVAQPVQQHRAHTSSLTHAAPKQNPDAAAAPAAAPAPAFYGAASAAPSAPPAAAPVPSPYAGAAAQFPAAPAGVAAAAGQGAEGVEFEPGTFEEGGEEWTVLQ